MRYHDTYATNEPQYATRSLLSRSRANTSYSNPQTNLAQLDLTSDDDAGSCPRGGAPRRYGGGPTAEAHLGASQGGRLD